ncbi:MAG: phytochelatin synthase family protein [Oligoflexia bacterium]
MGLLVWSNWVGAAPKYGPAKQPWATPLSQSPHYFRGSAQPAPDFWAMVGYYAPQMNGAACSVASVTQVLNAARSGISKDSETPIILQQALLDQVGGDWKKRIAPQGLSAVHPLAPRGVTLELLARFAKEAFQKNGFAAAETELVRIEGADALALERLRRDLVQNEKLATDFILANFDQKLLTDDASVGHVAPIAAYDQRNRRVLIMDPDREWYEPYWVSDEQLLKAMATKDPETGRNRGYVKIRTAK